MFLCSGALRVQGEHFDTSKVHLSGENSSFSPVYFYFIFSVAT